MHPTITAGILIGVLCGAWNVVLLAAGWHRDPITFNLFWIVILIELAVLIWGLRATARLGYGYGKQVGAGLVMSVIGGVILFAVSLLLTGVLFPNSLAELVDTQVEAYRMAGFSDQELANTRQTLEVGMTHFSQALNGCIGTVATGLVLSLIIAIFVRHKGAPAHEPSPAS